LSENQEMRETAAVIVNPIAGKRDGLRRAESVLRILEKAGLRAVSLETRRPGHGRELAREHAKRVQVLVCVGGDGTLNEVVNGLMDASSETPVAVIPAGTANMVSKELGLPPDLSSQVRPAVEGGLCWIDLGCTGERFFLLCAGAGFDAAVVEAMARKRQGRAISLRSYLPLVMAKMFQYPFPPIRVKVDGNLVDEETILAVVGNMPRYGGFFKLFRDATPQDGFLDVCCFKRKSPINFVRHAYSAYRGSLHEVEGDVAFHRGKEIILDSEGRVPFHVDGDPFGELPARIHVVPRAVSLCVPERTTARLWRP